MQRIEQKSLLDGCDAPQGASPKKSAEKQEATEVMKTVAVLNFCVGLATTLWVVGL